MRVSEKKRQLNKGEFFFSIGFWSVETDILRDELQISIFCVGKENENVEKNSLYNEKRRKKAKKAEPLCSK